MSKKEKTKEGSKSSPKRDAIASIVENVLSDIHSLYEGINAPEGAPAAMGLRKIANDPLLARVGEPLKVLSPRKKISVMIIGNHSAGKSSFLNWYCDEQIQKTGVAIETRGFTFISHGKKRETLKGEATLRYFEHIKEMEQFKGLIPNLNTEISTSRAKSFCAVDLIDSPGLVDGNMQYPYDVKAAILWLADHVDLILIFFDPVGQALCKRTMEVVEALNAGPHLEKVHYFLSKADTVLEEKDRYRVLIQITQNLAVKIRNSHAFKLPTFYLPNEANASCTVPNDIEDVCTEIDKTIQSTVQKWLKSLETDCKAVSGRIDAVLADDDRTRDWNKRSSTYGLLLNLIPALGALLLLLGFFAELWVHIPGLRGSALGSVHVAISRTAFPEGGLSDLHDAIGDAKLLAVLVGSVLVGLLANKVVWRTRPALSKGERARLVGWRAHVQEDVLPREKKLWENFFKSLNPDAAE